MDFSCDKSNLFMGYKDSTDVISFIFAKNVKGHLEFALYHNKVKAVIDRRACSCCRIVTLLCHICEMRVLSPVSFHFSICLDSQIWTKALHYFTCCYLLQMASTYKNKYISRNIIVSYEYFMSISQNNHFIAYQN